MAAKRITFEAPYGCRWCGDEQHHHGSQWAVIIGMHEWLEPSQAMILERMRRRRDVRLTAEPPKYHATTAWDPAPDGESADPYCADCQTPVCFRWSRIQARLDHHRWGIGYRTKHHLNATAAAGSWGGDDTNLPF